MAHICLGFWLIVALVFDDVLPVLSLGPFGLW
jgi:hypothetical protein